MLLEWFDLVFGDLVNARKKIIPNEKDEKGKEKAKNKTKKGQL